MSVGRRASEQCNRSAVRRVLVRLPIRSLHAGDIMIAVPPRLNLEPLQPPLVPCVMVCSTLSGHIVVQTHVPFAPVSRSGNERQLSRPARSIPNDGKETAAERQLSHKSNLLGKRLPAQDDPAGSLLRNLHQAAAEFWPRIAPGEYPIARLKARLKAACEP